MYQQRRYRVTGRVQGVHFRASTREQAQRLQLTGYAKNLPDGSVEVLAIGTSAALAQLAAWLEHGPPLARVEQVLLLDREHLTQRPAEFSVG